MIQRRTLGSFVGQIIQAGLQIEALVETPLDPGTVTDAHADPARWYSVARASVMPTTLIIKARKPARQGQSVGGIVKIEIVPYRSGLAAAFEAEASRLRAALKTLALRIDHHGSTAIPGLGAKPIIDIQVSVAALQPLRRTVRGSKPSDTFTCRIRTTRSVRSSIGRASGRTLITCMSSRGAGVKNDEHWRFETIFVTIATWLASMKTSNAPSPHKSWRPIPSRRNGMPWPRQTSSSESSALRFRGDILTRPVTSGASHCKMNRRLVSRRFPRSSAYHPEWIMASVSGGANSLWPPVLHTKF